MITSVVLEYVLLFLLPFCFIMQESVIMQALFLLPFCFIMQEKGSKT